MKYIVIGIKKLLHECNRILDTADEMISEVEVQRVSRKYQD